MAELLFKEESYAIQGAVYDVYKELGSGQKEKVYQNALLYALQERGLEVEREKRIQVRYRNKPVGIYIPDFVINTEILLELKAKPKLVREDIKQFWEYLKSTQYRLGYLINFGKVGGVQITRRIYDTARKNK